MMVYYCEWLGGLWCVISMQCINTFPFDIIVTFIT